MEKCVWKVSEADRLCGCCVRRQWCGVRAFPKRSAEEVGARYVEIVRRLAGADPLENTRRRENVWARNVVALRMSLDGYRGDEIGAVLGKDRTSVVHCVKNMQEALGRPGSYRFEVEVWNKFEEELNRRHYEEN